jgi:hypothetical protein
MGRNTPEEIDAHLILWRLDDLAIEHEDKKSIYYRIDAFYVHDSWK